MATKMPGIRRPGARKSFGEYKPLMIHIDERLGFCQRTEVLGQRGRLEIVQPQTKFYSGPSEIWHARRGITFKTRQEAIAFASKYIAEYEASWVKSRTEFEQRQARYAAQHAS